MGKKLETFDASKIAVPSVAETQDQLGSFAWPEELRRSLGLARALGEQGRTKGGLSDDVRLGSVVCALVGYALGRLAALDSDFARVKDGREPERKYASRARCTLPERAALKAAALAAAAGMESVELSPEDAAALEEVERHLRAAQREEYSRSVAALQSTVGDK
jgi:hypothetical protein